MCDTKKVCEKRKKKKKKEKKSHTKKCVRRKKKNQYLDWDATDCRLLEFLFTRTRTSVIFIYFAEMPKTETSLEGSRSVFVCFQNKLNK